MKGQHVNVKLDILKKNSTSEIFEMDPVSTPPKDIAIKSTLHKDTGKRLIIMITSLQINNTRRDMLKRMQEEMKKERIDFRLNFRTPNQTYDKLDLRTIA